MNSQISRYDIKKIEIDFSGNEKKVVVDGKEVDTNKIIQMKLLIHSGIIGLDATISCCELPIKG